jgi:tRNA threonylcarbamoyladenosine biosynthesis protein TsaB
MIVLGIRTDSPQTELYIIDNGAVCGQKSWESGRTLAATLLGEIDTLLSSNKFVVDDLDGIIFYEGPGSFTGLRIGASVANSIGYSLGIPIAAESGEQWLKAGKNSLSEHQGTSIVLPLYGSEPNITL